MRVATWNVNSVRLRLPSVLKLLDEAAPDVLCLQETKCRDEDFPLAAFAERGYVHAHIHGEKSYNGVAILSRLPLASPETPKWCAKDDCRHVAAVLPGGIEVHSLYIPAGGDAPDPEVNDKFAHKLRFVDELTAWWPGRAAAKRPMILVGDLNIAPLEHDVWSHKQLLDVVSHTPVEVAKLTAMRDSIGWVDAMRRFVPDDQKLYTWWSYRNRDWRKSDRGRRLDHVWVTPDLAPALTGMQVLKDARDWTQPSDHVPVVVDLAD